MSQIVALIDYGSGNLTSVAKAFESLSQDRFKVKICQTARELEGADRLVLPGVGAFAACMHALQARQGMIEILQAHVFMRQRPFLGICVGMQLLASSGQEHGISQGLNWIEGTVKEIVADRQNNIRVPHIGWNNLIIKHAHPLLAGLEAEQNIMYFVHSYHFMAQQPQDVMASVSYGGDLTALIARANIAGVQFHPEKSQKAGLRLLQNFLHWNP